MFKGISMLAAVVAVAGLVASIAVAGVTTNDVKQTIPFYVYVSCANSGAGEVVGGTVNLHTLITATINGNNVSGKYLYQPQGSHLVGLTTGDVYRATGNTQEPFTASLQNGRYTDTYVNNFRIIGPGTGNNYLVHEVAHITVNANGDVTAQFDNFNVDCK